MAITFDRGETQWVIRLEADVDVSCSAEFKRTLIEAFSSGKGLQVDLERATELDITALQLLWVAAREAEKVGGSFAIIGQVPANIRCTVRDAGFEKFFGPVTAKAATANLPTPRPESSDDSD